MQTNQRTMKGKKALSVTWWSIIISSFRTSQLKKNSMIYFILFFPNVTLCLSFIDVCFCLLPGSVAYAAALLVAKTQMMLFPMCPDW